jgi:hypothetical protein
MRNDFVRYAKLGYRRGYDRRRALSLWSNASPMAIGICQTMLSVPGSACARDVIDGAKMVTEK